MNDNEIIKKFFVKNGRLQEFCNHEFEYSEFGKFKEDRIREEWIQENYKYLEAEFLNSGARKEMLEAIRLARKDERKRILDKLKEFVVNNIK